MSRRHFTVMNAGSMLSLLLSLFCQPAATANDNWTQWGGANRDFNVAINQPLNGLNVEERWRRPLGAGYSAILVEQNRLYTMLRRQDNEHVTCLDATTGNTIWERSYAAPLSKDADASFGKGPNATPLLVGDSLVTIGFNGDLHCFHKKTGETQWKTNLITDQGGTQVKLGYSPSPILYKENIILPVGGKGNAIKAFRVQDGSVAWSALDYDNSYATPVLAPVDGINQMIFVMTDEVVSINPDTGAEYWKFPLLNQWSTHAFVPLWNPETNVLFISSFRQSHALKLTRDGDGIKVDQLWSNKKSGIGFTNAVRIGDTVYGSTGGSRSPMVTAIDLDSGRLLWKVRGFGVSNYLSLDDRLVLLDEKGMLAIAKPTASGLGVIDKQKILSVEKVWTVPTMIGNKLYARDQKEIVALELK